MKVLTKMEIEGCVCGWVTCFGICVGLFRQGSVHISGTQRDLVAAENATQVVGKKEQQYFPEMALIST